MAQPNHAKRFFDTQRAALAGETAVAIHSYGLILNHRRQWWLVEFGQVDTTPVAAHRLSGRMTPEMTNWMRRETGDPRHTANISTLNPDMTCWSGEFSRLPSSEDPDLFDIDTHPWGSAAGELETRLARTLVDSLLAPVPSGFMSVLTCVPTDDKPVLAIRHSGYVCSTFELLTARYMPDYRPRSPWRDISGDSVCDSGSDIIGWMPAADWVRPR